MKDLPMKLHLLIPGILLVLLAACSPPPNLRDATMWQDDSLLTGEPCAAPCWQGITPGETSWTEARIFIEDLVPEGQRQFQEQEGQIGGIWRTSETEQFCCAIVSNSGPSVDENDIVDYIQVRLAPNVTLGELIEVLGEPTYVVNGEEVSEDQAYIVLLYPDVPVIIYAFVAGAATGTLSESSEIVFVVYLTAEAMQNEVIANSSLQAWDGYESFAYYAEGEANPFEVTPEATSEATPDADATESASDATDEAELDATEEADAADADATTEATEDADSDATAEANATATP
jgi:hypothetical protein